MPKKEGQLHNRVYVRHAALDDSTQMEAAVEALFTALPAAACIGADTRVLLKPNLLRGNAPEAAVTTHPAVLRAVILAVQRRGAVDITVADSPGGPYTPAAMQAVYRSCGLAALCEEMGVKLYTDCKSVECKTAGQRVRAFTLLQPVLDSDFIINLPKMKTHVLTRMSGAVKNLFGCVPGLQKAEFHTRFPQRDDFVAMLVDLCEAVRPDMTIVDGLLAMEGDGPGSGTPRRCDLLFGGEDAYLVDLALCRVMGMPPMEVPVLAEAHARGLCPQAIPEEAFVGAAEDKQPLAGYVPPRSYSGRLDFSGNVPAVLRPVVSFFADRVAPRPRIDKTQCVGCGKCAEICPQKTIDIRNKKAIIHYKECIKCFCCHEICPVHAVEVKRFGLFGR